MVAEVPTIGLLGFPCLEGLFAFTILFVNTVKPSNVNFTSDEAVSGIPRRLPRDLRGSLLRGGALSAGEEFFLLLNFASPTLAEQIQVASWLLHASMSVNYCSNGSPPNL